MVKYQFYLKQNWDKIELEYDSLMKKSDEFNKILVDTEVKKEYKILISLFKNFKGNVRNIFFNVGINISNLTNINNDIDKNIDNSEKIKSSYDNIYNEFFNLESVIKEINNIQINIKKKKKKQIQNLENKLHEYMDEIDKLDFNKIDKFYNNFKNENLNEIENIILQNNFIEHYNYKEFDFQNENNNQQKNYLENPEINENNNNQINTKMNINTLNHDSESIYSENQNKIKIINGIVNMKQNNKDEAIKYIQSLIKKTSINYESNN